ncbi:LytR/AlgR family response regulator transcription factor [Alloscardovia omnicolens]|uniref:LytR/AlgR family response regulator transcription factor n=1 Tax=Alloscardovia omnicolens TaxID=419015 RepID=UPI0006674D27|nr:LytTR family DNA-binding domain-containing protein [Alloscardovia omnicolens]KWZ75526.1 LytTr DNA-binding domain protein [Alloscardovia omnicolens]MDK6327351.1 LytTR family DNA-binding domain-containing protein [Alloscardovia omnicolens]MDK6664112.1 LytTR family DNA-binding domain-containing protein [Alloscardovia omnicolens]MDK7748485.1 LytTR family DNA-binding domain-containing protein [Alloscardovia omnicolens]MDK8073811.1 LytTR family DNA-binding domain-containing protein [Alloscardovia
MLSIALVEDDDKAAETLSKFLDTFSSTHGTQFKITRFSDPTILLEDYKPVWDIVFMDIEMPNMNGMDAAYALRELDQKSVLIFVTNMAQFAAKGYEVNALDYIIKPYVYPDFERKIQRAVAVCAKADDSIVISFRGSGVRVRVSDIEYIEVRGHNVQYHTEIGILTSAGSLQKVQEILEPKGFIRCSKAYLVNPHHVMHVSSTELRVSSGDRVPVGRAYHKAFMQAFAAAMGNEGAML